MIAIGNRDEKAVLQERFRFPGETSTSLFYSFNYGMVHFISVSIQDNFTYGSEQYKFLEQDLKAAHRDIASKKKLKWIILFGHTPLYSSSNGHKGNR